MNNVSIQRDHKSDEWRTTHSVSVREQRRRQRLRRVRRQRMMLGIWLLCCVLLIGLFVFSGENTAAAESQEDSPLVRVLRDKIQTGSFGDLTQGLPTEEFRKHPDWTEDFLTPNEYSRPQEKLTEVKNIFVHYTANPGTSAAQNRSYFEQQKDTHQASVSSHFIIGYDGEIIQCVPLDEIAYAVQTRNYDSVSIECCFKAKNGQFTQETYDSLIELLVWLIEVYDLNSEDILRHYDCGGKKCPLYYTEHPDAWKLLKEDVAARIQR